MSEQYLHTTTTNFLAQLGRGKGMPGSGCAAAYAALMGISVLQSVCKITLKKVAHTQSRELLNSAYQELTEQHLPALEQLLQQDADAVSAMLNKNYTDALTTTPIAICNHSIASLKIALTIFDNTYRPMLGDSAAALAMIDGTIKATLFISQSNTRQNPKLKAEVEKMAATYLLLQPKIEKRLHQ